MIKFPLGQVVGTPPALALLEELGLSPLPLLDRHLAGDWGDLDSDDAKMNDDALESGEDRLFSSYLVGDPPQKVWVITEWDRSSTCVLLPSDY